MQNTGSDLPGDFTPVDGCVPDWIDIKEICRESKRFVGLYAVNGFNVVAINDGRSVFTTSDRDGEFRKRFEGAAAKKASVIKVGPLEGDAVLVYDCEQDLQWIAPRNSAVQFLYRQS